MTVSLDLDQSYVDGKLLRPGPPRIAFSLRLWRLDGSQISGQRTGILTCEAEGRHVRVATGQAFAQPTRKIVEVYAIAEIPECRRRRMRACPGFADGMTG